MDVGIQTGDSPATVAWPANQPPSLVSRAPCHPPGLVNRVPASGFEFTSAPSTATSTPDTGGGQTGREETSRNIPENSRPSLMRQVFSKICHVVHRSYCTMYQTYTSLIYSSCFLKGSYAEQIQALLRASNIGTTTLPGLEDQER